jgi:hypothetical protein
MCGPSASQENLANAEEGFMSQYSQAFNQRFAGQTSILNNINATLQPTLAKGPEQTGFSPEELAAYNTQALDTTGANYANAERAVGTAVAGQGDSAVESGVQQAEKAQVATAAAGQTSNEELGITEANYAQGRQNFNNAVAGEENVAQQESPSSFGSLTQTAEGQGFNQQTQINQEESQEQAAIAGGVMSLAGGVMSGGLTSLIPHGGGGGGDWDDEG